MLFTRFSGNRELCPPCFFVGDKWQKGMGRWAGYDFDETLFLKLAESRQKVAVMVLKQALRRSKELAIHYCERVQRQVVPSARNLLVCELYALLKVAPIARLQQRIVQHFCQGGRDGEREAAGYLILCHLAQSGGERKVAFRYGFKEPVFFEKRRKLRMPHIRQVSMKNDGKITDGHPKSMVPTESKRLARVEWQDGQEVWRLELKES